MKRFGIILTFLLLVCPVYGDAIDESTVNLVDKALEVFKTQGKDAAVKLCNASAGPLRKGSLYVFVVDFKGRMLSHPVQADLRNQDSWEVQDAKGKFIIQDFIKLAKEQGAGWYEYSWLRVNETAPTLKKTYIKRVPGEDCLVGCGYYVK